VSVSVSVLVFQSVSVFVHLYPLRTMGVGAVNWLTTSNGMDNEGRVIVS
jgi:hypothetical protein